MANDYWAKRVADSQTRLTDKSIKETNKQIKKYYSQTLFDVIGQFEKTYNKLISSITDGRQPTPADLYKLDSYWQLQIQLKEKLKKLGDKQSLLLANQFEDLYLTIYNSLAIKSDVSFSTLDEAAVKQMINQIWVADGKNWSQRLWQSTDKLQQALNEHLVECVVAGKKTSDLKKMLINDFDVSYGRVDSLVRTEMAHIQTQAAQHRYKDYGIKEVEVWVDEDERTCEICAKYEGRRYSINGQMPIPFHPRCRCCIVPVLSGADDKQQLK